MFPLCYDSCLIDDAASTNLDGAPIFWLTILGPHNKLISWDILPVAISVLVLGRLQPATAAASLTASLPQSLGKLSRQLIVYHASTAMNYDIARVEDFTAPKLAESLLSPE